MTTYSTGQPQSSVDTPFLQGGSATADFYLSPSCFFVCLSVFLEINDFFFTMIGSILTRQIVSVSTYETDCRCQYLRVVQIVITSGSLHYQQGFDFQFQFHSLTEKKIQLCTL